MTHRDEVHGDVRFDRLAVALIDTPAMQRLGRVYQLGYAPLVYRGGNHSRLSHVMGAYHMAGKLVDALRRNYASDIPRPRGAVDPHLFLPLRDKSVSMEDRWAVLRYLASWAALLHDLGHIPLGHTLEDEYEKVYKKHDDFESPRIPYLWYEIAPGQPSDIRRVFSSVQLHPEVVTRLGITGNQLLSAVMLTCFYREDRKGDTPRSFRDVLDGSAPSIARDELLRALDAVEDRLFFPYIVDIVADTICADYLDYLQRDPKNLGLDVLKDDRVVSHFWVGRRRITGRFHMALSLVDKRGKARLDTTTGVVDLVRQRYRFAEIVYYHKTKASASAMFAKALHLVTAPPECPPPDRLVVEADGIDSLVSRLFEERPTDGRLELTTFQRVVLPSALLDPEVGDESLQLMMQQRAAATVAEALNAEDRQAATRGLRALALLQGIARRRLYKVAFALDATAWLEFFPGSKRDDVARRELDKMIKRLRSDANERGALEEQMRVALSSGGAPGDLYDPFLLYVPPRKSQAKGIETGALDEGEIITLGEHDAVRAQVQDLNRKYADLWKLIVLVHPRFDDPVGLSRALKVLVEQLIPGVDLVEHGHARDAMKSCSWFEYVQVELHSAGGKYATLPLTAPRHYGHLADARRTAQGGITDDEIVYRAVVLDRLVDIGLEQADAIEAVSGGYPDAGSMTAAVERDRDKTDLFTGAEEGEGGALRETLGPNCGTPCSLARTSWQEQWVGSGPSRGDRHGRPPEIGCEGYPGAWSGVERFDAGAM